MKSIQLKAEGKESIWGVSTLLFIYREPISFHNCAVQISIYILKYINRFNFGNKSPATFIIFVIVPIIEEGVCAHIGVSRRQWDAKVGIVLEARKVIGQNTCPKASYFLEEGPKFSLKCIWMKPVFSKNKILLDIDQIKFSHVSSLYINH